MNLQRSFFHIFAMALLFCLGLSACSDRIHIYEGVSGPEKSTPLMAAAPLGPEQFDQGEPSRLAILITEDTSNWLSLARGLKTIGIPFRMTRDIDQALAHDVVMLYPQVTGLNLSLDELDTIRDFVSDGGTLIATNNLGRNLSDVFGHYGISENKSRYQLNFQNGFPATHDFADKGLLSHKIGSENDSAFNPGTNSYLAPVNPPLAIYENGEAAIISNSFGEGMAYAFGIDVGQLLAKGYNRRQIDTAESYANNYQPVLDSLLLFLKNIYTQSAAPVVTLGTVPNGKSLSFILSYDIDYSKSLRNAVSYAQHLKDEDISGTFFIQTKYIKDYNDKIFLNAQAGAILRELESLGVELASHSVAHSNAMWSFDVGTGEERYPDYQPYVHNYKRTTGASLMGELRVSKFLIDHFMKAQEVRSFRPGFLANPSALPEVLASTGYDYSSAVTANIALTHMPFQLSYGREFTALTPVFEIPITVEDELDGPMFNRLEASKKLARDISKIGGVFVALIHTDAVDSRLDYQKAMVDEVKPYAWIGSIGEFGDWWAARNEIELDITDSGNGIYEVQLNAARPIYGVTLELNVNSKILASTLPIDSMQLKKNRLLISKLSGSQTITISRQQ